ncbi:helix-turn-helix transcriptional regulator [Mucilaginibacter sp. CAU 1740]|uniref:helix-turn-helix domain-containing protein n=1 Tax=Mucilaginibacter sp. CAU 1740 TaxID=3140365 RepID=UPI00325A95A7
MDNIIIQKTKKITSNIRSIREHKAYSQDYLAARMQISQNAYSKIELGHTRLTVERLLHIAHIFDMQALDIINYRTMNAFDKKAENEMVLVG